MRSGTSWRVTRYLPKRSPSTACVASDEMPRNASTEMKVKTPPAMYTDCSPIVVTTKGFQLSLPSESLSMHGLLSYQRPAAVSGVPMPWHTWYRPAMCDVVKRVMDQKPMSRRMMLSKSMLVPTSGQGGPEQERNMVMMVTSAPSAAIAGPTTRMYVSPPLSAMQFKRNLPVAAWMSDVRQDVPYSAVMKARKTIILSWQRTLYIGPS
mmetsp:Transcript_41566/g.111464  ORF Transcript_41566/g.111464 Transcript_41566/m.111464 type:complete len:208 (-) Transcript_41566:583-1206(-)